MFVDLRCSTRSNASYLRDRTHPEARLPGIYAARKRQVTNLKEDIKYSVCHLCTTPTERVLRRDVSNTVHLFKHFSGERTTTRAC